MKEQLPYSDTFSFVLNKLRVYCNRHRLNSNKEDAEIIVSLFSTCFDTPKSITRSVMFNQTLLAITELNAAFTGKPDLKY